MHCTRLARYSVYNPRSPVTMFDAVGQFRLPPALDLTDANLAEAFRSWRRQVDFYLRASGASEKPKATQTAIILHCAGVQVQEVYEHFVFADDADKDDLQKVLDKLAEYCSPRSKSLRHIGLEYDISRTFPATHLSHT